MRTTPKIVIFCFCFLGVLLFEAASLYLVPDAYAILGTRRRTARRTAVVVGSSANAQTSAAQAEAAEANQQAAAAEQEAAEANARADAAEQQAAAAQAQPPSTATKPIGSVVTALPAGCNKTVIGGVEYYYDGHDYYRAAFQGSQLVYVTSQP